MTVTIGQYYMGFANLRAFFAAIPFVPLLFHWLNLGSDAIYLFPPLGDVQVIALAGSFGVLLVATFVVFVCCRIAHVVRPVVPALLMIGAMGLICALIALYVQFVRLAPVPAADTNVLVSVGYQRTDFALKNYAGESDWDMLHDRGPREESVQKLWTRRSILIVRMLLWLSYTGALACFLSAVSLGAYQHATECAKGQK
jgi:hypothetical protein